MIYLTSDLHGKLGPLKKLLEKANFSPKKDDTLYILGDAIDRNNNGGIDILKWIMGTPNVKFLLGNHEQMLLDSSWIFGDLSRVKLTAGMIGTLDRWKRNGGENTIAALKQETPECREEILDFLRTRPLYQTVWVDQKKYVLVHGGLGNYSPAKGMAEYSSDELLWERPYLTTTYAPKDFTVVLGHTPTYHYGKAYQNRMLKNGGWWNIDTGAAEPDRNPMLLCLDTGEAYYLEDGDTAQ